MAEAAGCIEYLKKFKVLILRAACFCEQGTSAELHSGCWCEGVFSSWRPEETAVAQSELWTDHSWPLAWLEAISGTSTWILLEKVWWGATLALVLARLGKWFEHRVVKELRKEIGLVVLLSHTEGNIIKDIIQVENWTSEWFLKNPYFLYR